MKAPFVVVTSLLAITWNAALASCDAPTLEEAKFVSSDLLEQRNSEYAQACSEVGQDLVDGDNLSLVDRITRPSGWTQYLDEYYPPSAKREGIQGEALLSIVVAADGKVSRVVLLKSTGHKILDDNAVLFFRRSRARKPPLLDGKPVNMFLTTNFGFRVAQ